MLGWPVLVHYCQTCHYNTPVEYSGTVWTKEHTCTHVSRGLLSQAVPSPLLD